MRHPIVILVSIAACLLGLIGCNGPDRESCDELIDEASELVEEFGRCNEGDTCQIVNMYDLAGDGNCLLAFQCARAVNADADLDSFRSQARDIVGDFRSCNQCTSAGCASPEGLVAECNVSQGRCETRDAE